MFATYTDRGEEYSSDLMIAQLNINNYSANGKALSNYQLRNQREIYLDNLKIFNLDIVSCQKKGYNEINKCQRYVY